MIEFFAVIGLASVVIAGLISAFLAHKPTRTTMWLVAYLVLVQGLTQWALATGLQSSNVPANDVVTAFVLFNIGNGLVITGRLLKERVANARFVVFGGGALLAVSLGLISLQLQSHGQLWTVAWLPVLMVVITIFMLIGMYLSARGRLKTTI